MIIFNCSIEYKINLINKINPIIKLNYNIILKRYSIDYFINLFAVYLINILLLDIIIYIYLFIF